MLWAGREILRELLDAQVPQKVRERNARGAIVRASSL